MDFPYVWYFRVYPVSEWPTPENPTPANRKGQRCRIVKHNNKSVLSLGARLPNGTWYRGMGMALVEFEDGSQFVTSRRGLRKRKEGDAQCVSASNTPSHSGS